ncbi:hypothetical protein [Acinetobacter beijerinckii]|uniref:hypothetical protein n=1 Tax=Acinetobacter beijerinckii TaxID=262668 RepID=UPI000697CA6B|nr:hypothetical protein [Acinetobacter beijerinckii]
MVMKKQNRPLSLRIDDSQQPYIDLLNRASLSTSEGIRMLIERSLNQINQIDLSNFNVNIEFNWNKTSNNSFPENVGCLRVNVTPPQNLSNEDLHRIVFLIPEFLKSNATNSSEYEPFRIDSYYFHRATNGRVGFESTKVRRNTLGFRLIDNKWRAGIFYYDFNEIDLKALETEITQRLKEHIESSIILFMIGQLSVERVLKDDELKTFNSITYKHNIEASDLSFE